MLFFHISKIHWGFDLGVVQRISISTISTFFNYHLFFYFISEIFIMNRGTRRSMGTVKNTVLPQRSSSSGFNAPSSQPSSAVRKSRLPTATGSHNSAKKRSSSNDGSRQRTSAALGQFRTPRSKSAALRTPSSHRAPLSVIGVNSGMKSPHSGKRSSIYGNFAHQKDARPLADREWQRQTAKNLVDFCVTQGYPNQALSLRDILQLVRFWDFLKISLVMCNQILPLVGLL